MLSVILAIVFVLIGLVWHLARNRPIEASSQPPEPSAQKETSSSPSKVSSFSEQSQSSLELGDDSNFGSDRYQLAFKFTHETLSKWNDVNSIHDLVLPHTNRPSWLKVFSTPPKSQDTIFRQKFLISALRHILSRLDKKPLRGKIACLYNLEMIQSRRILASSDIDDFINQTDSHLRGYLDSAFEAIRDVHVRYKELVGSVDKGAPPPLSDLKEYVLEDGCLDAPKYVAYLDKQIKVNFDMLDRIDILTTLELRPPLQVIMSAISDLRELDISFEISEKSKQSMSTRVREIKDSMTEMLNFAQIHLQSCNTVLPDIPLPIFRSIRGVDFLNNHRAELDKFFALADGALPAFPFTVVHVGQLKEDSVEVKTEQQYKIMKRTYDQLVTLSDRIKKSLPKEFPKELPNLSTHDFSPRLLIRNERDYIIVVKSFAEYLRRLEQLKKNWTSTVRHLYNVLESSGGLFE